MRSKFSRLLCALAFVGVALNVWAQETDETTLRVRTRVVFLDALVKEKRTGQSISDLKPENFEVLADGQPSKISYFTREGEQGRRPLALALIFDLQRIGAGRFLRRAEILAAMATELTKLPPEDEVAVIVINARGADGNCKWLTSFTRDRAQVAGVLSIIPTLVAPAGGDSGTTPSASPSPSPSPNTDKRAESMSPPPQAKDKEATTDRAHDQPAITEGGETERIVGKDGSIVTRTIKPDGSIETKRINKSGTVTVDLDTASDLPVATYEVTRVAARERPHSQAAMVYVTDGIVPMFYAERDYIETKLIKTNLIFSALVTDMKTGFKLAMPVLKPLGNWVGLSIYGGAQHLARQTGGEVVRVRRPADYANGLRKIVGNLSARYSLGFTLAEGEQDDGHMHPLEVKARARDAKNKERQLEVNARRGFFMPKEADISKAKDAGGTMNDE